MLQHNAMGDETGNRLTKTKISTGDKEEYTWDHRNRVSKITFKDSGGSVLKTVERRKRGCVQLLAIRFATTLLHQFHRKLCGCSTCLKAPAGRAEINATENSASPLDSKIVCVYNCFNRRRRSIRSFSTRAEKGDASNKDAIPPALFAQHFFINSAGHFADPAPA